MPNKLPKLTLIGAGPGDPDLMTIKGVKALADADAVLYDALVHPEIMKYIPARAEKLFVGKRVGSCQFPQEKINELIVEYAFKYGHVVRLKGGDPFIFGRGHEELIYAQSFYVPVEVVPGVSSFYSVPELQNIPLTRRGFNESFWVITGTTKSHELSGDVAVAAKSNATVVILMGTRKLAQIAELFKAEKKGDTPVAIIQNGSMPDEKVVLGDVDNIVSRAEENQVSSPAIIVIGEVVRLHPEFLHKEMIQNLIQIKR